MKNFHTFASRVLCLACVLQLAACAGPQKEAIPTGVFKQELEDGTVRLKVTGRASPNAIEKGLLVMKRTTSREAARLMLEQALEKLRMEHPGGDFQEGETGFLEQGEYCTILGVFTP